MKLQMKFMETIRRLVDSLQPQVAYATPTGFAQANDCWGCGNDCSSNCTGGCEGSCQNGCNDSCKNNCNDQYN